MNMRNQLSLHIQYILCDLIVEAVFFGAVFAMTYLVALNKRVALSKRKTTSYTNQKIKAS